MGCRDEDCYSLGLHLAVGLCYYGFKFKVSSGSKTSYNKVCSFLTAQIHCQPGVGKYFDVVSALCQWGDGIAYQADPGLRSCRTALKLTAGHPCAPW